MSHLKNEGPTAVLFLYFSIFGLGLRGNLTRAPLEPIRAFLGHDLHGPQEAWKGLLWQRASVQVQPL